MKYHYLAVSLNGNRLTNIEPFHGPTHVWTSAGITQAGAHADPRVSLVAARRVAAYWSGSNRRYTVLEDLK